MFRNRNDAALQLAERLQGYRGQNPLILGIPRGGVVVGSVLARQLKGEFDIILTRKLRMPGNPEFAIGSVDENGGVYVNKPAVRVLQISDGVIEEEKRRQLAVIRARAESYRRIHPKIPLEGRIVIITDDGIATGATMRAAIQIAGSARPKSLVVALPVGPLEQVAELERDVDEMVCLFTPANFLAVGQFYESFDQVDNKDVERILLGHPKSGAENSGGNSDAEASNG